MIHEWRRTARYPLAGSATLSSGNESVMARVLDVSTGGVLLGVDPQTASTLSHRKTWLCRIDSPDLPAPVRFLARQVRKRAGLDGFGLGCEITAINNDQLVVLKAYRALAEIRSNPHRQPERPNETLADASPVE